MFAVGNTALINMLMASRLIYGMANQEVLPLRVGKVLPGSPFAVGRHRPLNRCSRSALIFLVAPCGLKGGRGALGTTGLLLLCVFSVVNVACLVLRRDKAGGRARSGPRPVPVLGAVVCLFLVGPWARTPRTTLQYRIAGGLLGLGVVLWCSRGHQPRGASKETGFRDSNQSKE